MLIALKLRYCNHQMFTVFYCHNSKFYQFLTVRCCNTCDDVKEAYRQKGWAFHSPELIEQCRRDGFADLVKEQLNEGCRVYGYLEVNKV